MSPPPAAVVQLAKLASDGPTPAPGQGGSGAHDGDGEPVDVDGVTVDVDGAADGDASVAGAGGGVAASAAVDPSVADALLSRLKLLDSIGQTWDEKVRLLSLPCCAYRRPVQLPDHATDRGVSMGWAA